MYIPDTIIGQVNFFSTGDYEVFFLYVQVKKFLDESCSIRDEYGVQRCRSKDLPMPTIPRPAEIHWMLAHVCAEDPCTIHTDEDNLSVTGVQFCILNVIGRGSC